MSKKYQSRKTGEIAEVILETSSYTNLKMANGEKKEIKSSTLKRWWKEVVEEKVKEPQQEIVSDPILEDIDPISEEELKEGEPKIKVEPEDYKKPEVKLVKEEKESIPVLQHRKKSIEVEIPTYLEEINKKVDGIGGKITYLESGKMYNILVNGKSIMGVQPQKKKIVVRTKHNINGGYEYHAVKHNFNTHVFLDYDNANEGLIKLFDLCYADSLKK